MPIKHKSMWTSLGRRGPLNTQKRPNVSIREIALLHPNSVYASLLSRSNWIAKLNISPLAKRLTRLRGDEFRKAIQHLSN